MTSMVLTASASPMAIAKALPPASVALTATACASASMLELSVAVTVMPPTPAHTLSTTPARHGVVAAPMPALTVMAIVLSVHRPPALSVTALPVLSATATAVACTTAVTVAVPWALTVIPFAANSGVRRVVARTCSGAEPSYRVQPMRLRATEIPMATAGVVPGLAATAIASALTTALMVAVCSAVTRRLPAATSRLSTTSALAVPVMTLRAVAPPPLKATDFSALTATVIADAVDVASIDAFPTALTATLPLRASTSGTRRTAASITVLISLRVRLSPTATPVAEPAPAATASAGASTRALMETTSVASTARSPTAATTDGASSTTARTCVLTRFNAMTAATAMASVASVRLALMATAEVSTEALIDAAEVARTRTAPPEAMVLRRTIAVVRVGVRVPMSRPKTVSARLNTMFCGA